MITKVFLIIAVTAAAIAQISASEALLHQKCIVLLAQIEQDMEPEMKPALFLANDTTRYGEDAIIEGRDTVRRAVLGLHDDFDDLHREFHYTKRCFMGKRDLIEQIPVIFNEEIRLCVNHRLMEVGNIELELGPIIQHKFFFDALRARVSDCGNPDGAFYKSLREFKSNFEKLKQETEVIIRRAEKHAHSLIHYFDFCARYRDDIIEEEGQEILDSIKKCLGVI